MRRSSSVRGLSWAAVLFWSALAGAAVQENVEIDVGSIQCWPTDQFLVVRPSFQPPTDIQTAKFYFRSIDQPDYYYVEMAVSPQGAGRVVVPKAEPRTPAVAFYAELVTRGYSAFRTEEMTVPVASGSECRRQDPGAAYYTGPNPDISLGATRAGPSLAPGFQADGITHFISSTGIGAQAGGGGIGAKTAALLGGGGAGVALALLSGGSKDNAGLALGGNTTVTSTAVSTTTAISGGSSSTTTTAGGGTSPTTTVFGGPTTTTVTAGSTTTVVGSSTTSTGTSSTTTTVVGSSTTTSTGTSSSTTTSTGTSSSTTTSTGTSTSTTSSTSSTTSSTTTTAAAARSDLAITRVSQSLSPLTAPLAATYTIDFDNLSGSTENSPRVDITLSPPSTGRISFSSANGGCNSVSGGGSPGQPLVVSCQNIGPMAVGNPKEIRLIVGLLDPGTYRLSVSISGSNSDPVPSNNSGGLNSTANLIAGSEAARLLRTSFVSELFGGARGGVQGNFELNGQYHFSLDNSSPRQFVYQGRKGENLVTAVAQASDFHGILWRFDFTNSDPFEPGSFQIELGDVASVEGRIVVFHLEGTQGRIRFRYRLSR